MHECADLGIERSDAPVVRRRQRLRHGDALRSASTGISRHRRRLARACSALTADSGHKVMKVFATLAGNIPKKV
jgi:uncharacterized protein YjiS (DUF1127 family)